MPPQKSLQAFLATARAALTAPPSKRSAPLHFVVGNESADLDTLCSTLFLAYFRSHSPPHTLHIPLCHLPRDDIALRPEFSAVLKHAAVSEDDVLTLSELPGPESLRPEDTRWLLVDHNVMTGALGQSYGNRVVGCIDHHDDEGKVPKDVEPRVIEKCGSCMSLVVEHCRETWQTLVKESDDGYGEAARIKARINAQLAYLALAPILIDTNNLGNKNKTTAHDERAVSIAEAHLSPFIFTSTSFPSSTSTSTSHNSNSDPDSSYDRARFFAKLSALKEDISPMSFRDIFRKDYKEWDENNIKLGTSSVPQSFAFLVRKAGGERAFVRELEDWGAQKGLDVVTVLTTSKDGGEFRRELLVWARSGPEIVAAVKKFAEGDGKERLGLGIWGDGKLDADGEGNWRRCWTQARLENSRKQIAPMLRDALKGAKA
ncbi:DHH phosphoesterase [Hypoxylon sp. FL1857]|nr:DHH phosphoesterase [Hypoxylon sp. FL1857]